MLKTTSKPVLPPVAAQAKGESRLLKYYEQFEPLAETYAWRLFQSQKIGMDFEDLVQEFKIKIYLSLIGYAHYVKKKRGTRYTPWPIELYVRCALNNLRKDFIKRISAAPNKSISIESDGFDYSQEHSMESHIIISKNFCKAEINGVDLLEGLTLIEQRCFLLFLRGHTIKKLERMFRNVVPDAGAVIQRQVAKLQTKKQQLMADTVISYKNFFTDLENN
jgi:hypothetical protein